MAEIQQGGYALIFGLPDMDSNSVKIGTTSTPAAVKFKVTGLSFDAAHQEEVTYDTDGARAHVSSFDFTHTVSLTGHFHDTTRANAVVASNAWDLTSGAESGLQTSAHLVLTAKSAGVKPDDRTFSAAGKAYRITSVRMEYSTSAKQMFTIGAIYEPGMAYTHV